jgi:hypothetical protein
MIDQYYLVSRHDLATHQQPALTPVPRRANLRAQPGQYHRAIDLTGMGRHFHIVYNLGYGLTPQLQYAGIIGRDLVKS